MEGGAPFPHPPHSMGWLVVDITVECVCVCTHNEGGLAPAPFLPQVVNETGFFATTGEGTSLIPAPFTIMAECYLGGSAGGHLVQLPIEVELFHGWCRRWL